MDMQDKEFDELFRSKLDGFEIEPSAGVWTSITARLNMGKRKKVLAPFLGIAASIIVLVAAGILFIPQQQPVNNKPPAQNKTAIITRPTSKLLATKNNTVPVVSKLKGSGMLPVKLNAVNSIAVQHHTERIIYNPGKNVDQAIEQKQSAKTDEQPELAAIPQKQQDAVRTGMPNEDIPMTAKKNLAETKFVTDITTPELAVMQIPADVKRPDSSPVKTKHRMRSLGGLINLAIAAVDKRRDKVIEFTDTDDEESNITGINLGIIKIKKEK